jgi:hypothetical protein
LPGDALAADNHRWCVVTLEAGESALIVDGDPDERSAYYLQSIFRPGSKARTGIVPSLQPVSYLRDASLEELLTHRAVYLLDVPPLDERSRENLRAYVDAGGGVACFVGPNSNSAFYTDWYDAGFFPAPLGLPQTHTSPEDAPAADVQFDDHILFRALTGQRNPLAAAIRIGQYVVTPERWKPPMDSGIEVLARLSDGQPLVIRRAVGQGQVIAFLTTLAPDWNNWSLEPSFIVVALQLHAQLAQPRLPRADRLVGQSLSIEVDAEEFQPQITFVTPTDQPRVPRELSKVAVAGNPQGAPRWLASLGESHVGATAGETDFSGVYDAQLNTLDGKLQHRRYALNVDPREGLLASADAAALRSALEPLKVFVIQSDQPIQAATDASGNSWSEILLGLLLVLLLVEQWLAYRLSYHPNSVPATGATA